MSTRRRLYSRLIDGAALIYSSGILSEALLGWKLDPRFTLLSELAAKDREHRRIFQASDLIAGSLFVAAGATAPAHAPVLLRTCLKIFGIATIADALSPLDYPISHDHLRPEAQGYPGHRTLSHYSHYLTTTVAGVAATGVCLHDWQAHRFQKGSLRKFAGPAVIAAQVAGIASLSSEKLLPGAVQRIQTLGFTLLCWEIARHDKQVAR
ncbi:DUF998 domain-containing protein [Glutamicibacter sp. JC586]|uniref:DUF998 domain-containing protein n=1 Tax=Glutamicibacter sp. JC586 TaxID=2590552 RepID=UPI0013584779|nr:DUF998 domain-containing protein [Glutamicibacter sp. JC586]